MQLMRIIIINIYLEPQPLQKLMQNTDASNILFNETASQYKSLNAVEFSTPPALNNQSLTHSFSKLMKALSKRLRNIDGIDETAASLALIRGVTGPIASEAVFVIGFPFVVLGLIGMSDESKEADDAFKELFKGNQALKEQLKTLQIKSQDERSKEPKFRNQLEQDIKQSQQQIINYFKKNHTNIGDTKIKSAVDVFCQLNGLNKESNQKLYEKCGAPFGKFAMASMTAGMLPGMAWGAGEIAARAMSQTVPQTYKGITAASTATKGLDSTGTAAQVSSIAGVATSMIFAPANTAMAVYGIYRGLAGTSRNKTLKQFKKLNATQNDNHTTARKLVAEHIKAEQSTNNQTHRIYGAVTAIGQGMLAASGALAIAGFFGASVTFTGGLALPIVGAALAIGAAIVRIRGEEVEDNRKGQTETEEETQDQLARWHNRQEQYTPDRTQEPTTITRWQTLTTEANQANVVTEKSSNKLLNTNPLEDTIKEKQITINQDIKQASVDLARDKLLSLIQHAVSQHDNPKKRLEALDQWVYKHNGKRGIMIGKGTTMLNETARQIKQQYTLNNQLIQEMIGLKNKGEIASALLREQNFTSNTAIVAALKEQNVLPEILAKVGAQMSLF